MTSVPRDIATPPPPEREDPLPRNPRTVPASRNGLPETRHYTWQHKPVPPGAPDEAEEYTTSTAKTRAAAYRCPECGSTEVKVGQRVRPEHEPGCPVAARCRKAAGEGGEAAA